MTAKQGRNASRSGKRGEDIVYAALLPYVEAIVHHKDRSGLARPYAVYQPPTNHPYNEKPRAGKGDYMVYSDRTMLIQVKNQNVSGTADEKVPMTFSIAKCTIHETPFDLFLLVLLGDHWITRPKIKEFCKREAEHFTLVNKHYGLMVEADVVVGAQELSHYLKEFFNGKV